jgi:outer membrane protein assembly factor BamB
MRFPGYRFAVRRCALVGLYCALTASDPVFAQDPWADQVIAYEPGSGAAPGYTDPLTVLGPPERYTGELGGWPQAVTPFNPPWGTDELVSLGSGGHLIVRFDEPITDDPGHLFGVDFLLFANAFFIDANFPEGVVGGLFQHGPFAVSVSADGQNFVSLGGPFYDGLFPTMGYQDTLPQDPNPGSVLTDFTRPVDPRLTLSDLMGRSYAELVALYDGSGGGVPFDIGSTGLQQAYYVRIDALPGVSGLAIDAFAIVPEPSTLLAFCVAGAGLLCRRWRAGLVVAFFATPCRAGVWTHQAGDSARTSQAQLGPQQLATLAWSAAAPPEAEFVYHSSPVVSGGRVFAIARQFSDDQLVADLLVAYDSHTGQQLWATPIEPDYSDSWSSPAIDVRNQSVIVASGWSVYAIDAASGQIRWQTRLPRPVVNASPAVSQDLRAGGVPANRVFITDYSGYGNQALLYAINVDPFEPSHNPYQPGQIVWTQMLPGACGNSPAYADGLVCVASTGGWVFALAALDGNLRWQINVAELGYPQYARFFGGVCIREGFVYAASYVFYGTGNNSGLFKLDLQTGGLAWVAPCQRTDSVPVVTDDGWVFLSGGLDWTGSGVRIQAFRDLGTSAVLVWDTHVDSGGQLRVGGWSFQPAYSGGRLYAGRPDATFFGPYTDLYILNGAAGPGQPDFVLAQHAGAGGSPALAGGWLYSIGPAGLCAFAQRYPGDLDCSGSVNAFDIDPFVLALTSPAEYAGEFPDCDPLNADINGDGAVDAFDIDAFVDLLTG